MGSVSGMIWRWGGWTFLVLIIGVGRVLADTTTELGSSILFFPKVLSDSQGLQTGSPVDTIIQISNTSNSMVFAHCFYVNAAPLDPTLPPGLLNPSQWQEVDFFIFLTKQQPTHWVVSAGRSALVQDQEPCTRTRRDCNGAGFDPGRVPPVDDPFTGELKCIEVDATDVPLNGNHLKGEATLITPAGDASKYNAIGILGLNTEQNSNNGDQTLCLGGGVSDQCTRAEYNGCPQTVIVNHFAENATDPAVETLGHGPSRVTSELTIVPCSEDFENQVPEEVTIQFKLTNEFEEQFSASTTVTCWANLKLSRIAARIFDVSVLGSRFVQTRMTAATPDQPGFVGVLEEFHQQPDAISRAALNLHVEGVRPNPDVILLPEVQ